MLAGFLQKDYGPYWMMRDFDKARSASSFQLVFTYHIIFAVLLLLILLFVAMLLWEKIQTERQFNNRAKNSTRSRNRK